MKKGDPGEGVRVSRNVSIATQVLPEGLAKEGLLQLRHHLWLTVKEGREQVLESGQPELIHPYLDP